MSGDLAAAVAHHDDHLGRADLPGGNQHMIEHACATDRVQYLRELGFHSRPRPRGKDDDSGRTAHSHVAVLLDWLLRGRPRPISVTTGHEARTRPVYLPDLRRIPPSSAAGGRMRGGHDRHHMTVRNRSGGARRRL